MSGRELLPASATSLSGHHAHGMVSFIMSEPPLLFDIVILGVPDQPERVLTWPVPRHGLVGGPFD